MSSDVRSALPDQVLIVCEASASADNDPEGASEPAITRGKSIILIRSRSQGPEISHNLPKGALGG